MSEDKTFCALAWVHSFVNSNGNYQVCCTSEEYHVGIPDAQGAFFNIKNRPSHEEVMNSAFFSNIRKDMLSGKWNEVCTRCFVTEDNGGVSRREIENKKYSGLIETLKKETNPDGSLKHLKFKSIDYRLGNFCNLECRMCGPHSSSRWLKDWNDVKPQDEQISSSYRILLENYDWIEKDSLIDEFKEKLLHVEHLHFAGGEPLIAPQMTKMLKICVEMGVAQNITLSYNTNVTALPESVLELWKEFKAVRLLCSIDGFDKVNEYIRYPSKWEKIDKNLTFLDENFNKYKIEEILLSCTVQIYNVLSLESLYDYLKKFKNIVPALNLVNLHVPFYLKTTLLPPEAKALASQRLKKIADDLRGRLPEKYSYLEQNISQVTNFMNNVDHSDQLKIFKTVNANIDRVKQTRLKDHVPELEFLLIDSLRLKEGELSSF